MKIKTFVLLFNPKKDELSRWIELDVSLYCNTPISVGNVNYYGNCTNIGIASALLDMANISRREGCDGFIFFDQDTIIDKKVLKIMSDKLNSVTTKSLIHFSGIYLSNSQVNYVINSCTYFPNSLIEISTEQGLLNYFVDAVDLFISVEARKHGYSIHRHYISDINHIDNQDWSDFKIFKRKFRLKNYSEDRVKELIAGHLRLLRKVCSQFLFKDTLYALKLVVSITMWTMYRYILINFARKL